MQDVFNKIELLGTIAGKVDIEALLDYIENNAKMTKVVFDNIISKLCEMKDPIKMRPLAQRAVALRSQETYKKNEFALLEAIANEKFIKYIEKHREQFTKLVALEIDS